MSQPKIWSAIESVANVIIGFVVALISQWLVFPMFGIHATLSDNLGIAAWFTGISLVRSYVVRRAFNAMRVK